MKRQFLEVESFALDRYISARVGESLDYEDVNSAPDWFPVLDGHSLWGHPTKIESLVCCFGDSVNFTRNVVLGPRLANPNCIGFAW